MTEQTDAAEVLPGTWRNHDDPRDEWPGADGPDVEGVVRSSLEGRCGNCLLPIATASDWDTYGEGEGEHLCWEPESCMAAEGDLAAHVAAALRAEVGRWLGSEEAVSAAARAINRADDEALEASNFGALCATYDDQARAALAALAEQVRQVAPSRVPGEGS